MVFSILVLLTAICLSLVSGYYSIVGLTAIFAAAFWPIVIMGGTLELSKIMATLWLHYNWERAEWKIKSYLVMSVIVLMMVTTMGTFGFLSKAHLDQGIPSGDIQAQVSLFDEKIKIERDNIANDRALIKQLDDVVNNKNAEAPREIKRKDGTTYTESTAERALAIRRSQSKDRENLTKDIDKAQKNIVALQEQRAPVASKARKADADVGPIRYIAALIYGDNPDQNTLESAVRFVIIMIVLVFDPLAIVLLLASTTSIDWIKEEREGKQEKIETTYIDEEELTKKITEKANALAKAQGEIEVEKFKLEECSKCVAFIDKNLRIAEEQLAEKERAQSATEEELVEVAGMLSDKTNEINNLAPMLNELEEECSSLLSEKERLEKSAQEAKEKIEELQKKDEEPPVPEPEPLPEPVPALVIESEPIKLPLETNASFGIEYPKHPANGDLFLRVDYMPSKLFKWVGNRWLELDKEKTDIYAYDIEYIKLLVEKVSTGEYDIDDLSAIEQKQIEEYLRKTHNI